MAWRENLRGLYAVLDRPDASLARALCRGGAKVIQVRLKNGSDAAILAAAGAAKDAGAMVVVNDRVDLALLSGADGVHLGQGDLPIAEARALSARHDRPLIIGASTHNADEVAAALSAGADYLGFGPVFATATKANPDPVVGIAGLAAAVRQAHPTPVIAIGGVTAATAGAIFETGAHGACAIAAVNHAADPAAAAAAIAAAWSR
ncbi:MAG TPA: thiamine phosphate synthase [Kofleriaceae bacterium]|nr:thiamine phosphate synthase [Kofleriaceae bacterium]